MAELKLAPPAAEPSAPADPVVTEVIDELGRRLKVRDPDVLQESRLVRAMGDASMNTAYMLAYVMPAAMVVEIDGEAQQFPMSEREVEAAIKRLGRQGIAAVMKSVNDKATKMKGEGGDIKK